MACDGETVKGLDADQTHHVRIHFLGDSDTYLSHISLAKPEDGDTYTLL